MILLIKNIQKLIELIFYVFKIYALFVINRTMKITINYFVYKLLRDNLNN